MSYDKAKYDKLRSLEVPRKLALALSDDESPVSGGSVSAGGTGIYAFTQDEFDAFTEEEFAAIPDGSFLVSYDPANGQALNFRIKVTTEGDPIGGFEPI